MGSVEDKHQEQLGSQLELLQACELEFWMVQTDTVGKLNIDIPSCNIKHLNTNKNTVKL